MTPPSSDRLRYRRRGRGVAAWTAAAAAARPAGRRAGLSFQERRRADQRDRDRVRRERTVRARPAAGRLSRLRRRPAGGSHALQRRAGAGQPRHRPRHERQHGGREDSRKRRARWIASCSTCSTSRTRSSSIASATIRCSCRDGRRDRQLLSRALGRIVAERRHGDVRRHRRGDSAGAARDRIGRRRSC